MLAYDALTDAQAQARSLGPGREERIEDARQGGCRDAGTVVPDLHLDDIEDGRLAPRKQPVRGAAAEPPALRRALPRGGDRDEDFPSLRQGLQRVHEDVQEHLENLVVVDVELRNPVRPVDAQQDVLADRQLVDERERLLQSGQDGVAGELRRRRPRELEQALDDSIEARDFLQDQVGELPAGIPALDPPLQELRRGSDARERVSNFMGHTGRERAQGGEAVAAPPLLFLRLLLPEVLEKSHSSNQGSVAAFERKKPKPHRKDIAAASHDLHLASLLRFRARPGRHVPLAARGTEDARRGLALHLFRLVPDQFRGGWIDGKDATLAVYREKADRRVAEEAPGDIERATAGLRGFRTGEG